jgi:hypothetical protein
MNRELPPTDSESEEGSEVVVEEQQLHEAAAGHACGSEDAEQGGRAAARKSGQGEQEAGKELESLAGSPAGVSGPGG